MKKSVLALLIVGLILLCGCNKTEAKDMSVTKKVDQVSTEAVEGLTWLVDYDMALVQAKEENKVVFINFTGSDWCSWCIKLKGEVFSKDAFIKYANENLVLLELDFPKEFKKLPADVQERRQKLMEKYGVQGFPTILLADHEGNEISRTGYQAGGPDAYVKHLKELISK